MMLGQTYKALAMKNAKFNPTRAITYIDEIIDACLTLSQHPERCALTPQFGKDVRRLLHGEYGIFFRIFDQTIQVSRVLHGHRRIRSAMVP
jgi:toxin ParE1/3/4